MPPTMDSAALKEAAIDALADGSFQLVSCVEQPKKWVSHVCIGTTPFQAGVTGEVLVVASVPMAKEIAATMLGRDPTSAEVSVEQGREALAEASQIVAAALLTTWIGEDADWDLGPSRGEEGMPGDYEDRRLTAAWTALLETDTGQRLDVLIHLTNP